MSGKPLDLLEQYPHPLSELARAKILFAWKRALTQGNGNEVTRLEQFAQSNAELAREMRAQRPLLERVGAK